MTQSETEEDQDVVEEPVEEVIPFFPVTYSDDITVTAEVEGELTGSITFTTSIYFEEFDVPDEDVEEEWTVEEEVIA